VRSLRGHRSNTGDGFEQTNLSGVALGDVGHTDPLSGNPASSVLRGFFFAEVSGGVGKVKAGHKFT
jgi:hypothetical protein